MSATNAFETSLLQLILKNTTLANLGDATGVVGSGTDGNLFISLHTADPGETGTQLTSEAAYTSYARVTVNRTTGWTVSGATGDNLAAITFPQATGGGETEVSFVVGSAGNGTGNAFLYGSLTSALGVSNGITPEFAAGALDITLD